MSPRLSARALRAADQPIGYLMERALAQPELVSLALEEGVLYVPGRFCFPELAEPAPRSCIRLSFGVQSEAGIELGVRRLSRALERVRTSPVAGALGRTGAS